MRAQVGDELIVESTVPVRSRRVGVVVGLKNADGSPPYLVHWVVGDYNSLIYPGPGTQIKLRPRARHADRRSGGIASRGITSAPVAVQEEQGLRARGDLPEVVPDADPDR